MTLETQLFTIAATTGGGFLAGWGFGWLIKTVIKLVAIVGGTITGIIMYLNTQGVVQVDWQKLQAMTAHGATWIASLIPADSVNSVASSVGFSSTMGMVPGFFFGFMKGVRG